MKAPLNRNKPTKTLIYKLEKMTIYSLSNYTLLKSDLVASSKYLDKCKKLQFIYTVKGDRSKTAKIIKRQY